MLRLDKRIYDKCNNTIIITGAARSGTTILGKIIHSFKNVEYAFEPPILVSLFSLIYVISEQNWKLLYETYLYEDFLLNALAGRNLNCNRVDDSSIYKVKKESEIKNRQSISLSKIEAENSMLSHQIAWKMPDIVPFVPKLKEYYPKTKVIAITRRAPEVIISLVEKKWHTIETLNKQNLIWPNRFINSIRIPFWVKKEDDILWFEMNELDRCAYHYLRMNEAIKDIPNCKIIKYDELITNPSGTMEKLSKEFQLSWGEKTDEIIRVVKRTKKDRDVKILEKISSPLREKVEHFSDMY